MFGEWLGRFGWFLEIELKFFSILRPLHKLQIVTKDSNIRRNRCYHYVMAAFPFMNLRVGSTSYRPTHLFKSTRNKSGKTTEKKCFAETAEHKSMKIFFNIVNYGNLKAEREKKQTQTLFTLLKIHAFNMFTIFRVPVALSLSL